MIFLFSLDLMSWHHKSCSCFIFRFDECGISPLTVKALTDAGYIQTTVVQEAALPVCLEGIISYFTFLVNEFPESRGKNHNLLAVISWDVLFDFSSLYLALDSSSTILAVHELSEDAITETLQRSGDCSSLINV